MRDAEYLRAEVEYCLKPVHRAKRSDVREALLSLAQNFEADARANEAGADIAPSEAKRGSIRKR